MVMMPRLQADERMELVRTHVAAEGRILKDPDYRRMMSTLEAISEGRERARPVKPTWEQLGEIGIHVRRESAEKPDQSRRRERRAREEAAAKSG
jgi:hypothetical protein